jgi:hypothetical protein
MARGWGEVKDWSQSNWLGSGLSRLGALVLDQLYPPVCAGCGGPLMASDALCGACFAQLRPITEPLCPVLGLPFDSDPGGGALSAEAIADPPRSDGPGLQWPMERWREPLSAISNMVIDQNWRGFAPG